MLPWWAGLRFAFPEVLVWGCLPASVLPIRRAGGPVLPAGASAAEVFAEEPCCRLERTVLCVFPCSSSSLCSPAASAACKLRGVGKSVIFPKEGGGGASKRDPEGLPMSLVLLGLFQIYLVCSL